MSGYSGKRVMLQITNLHYMYVSVNSRLMATSLPKPKFGEATKHGIETVAAVAELMIQISCNSSNRHLFLFQNSNCNSCTCGIDSILRSLSDIISETTSVTLV